LERSRAFSFQLGLIYKNKTKKMISKLKFLTSHFDRIIQPSADGLGYIFYTEKNVVDGRRVQYIVDLYENKITYQTIGEDDDITSPEDPIIISEMVAPASDKQLFIDANLGTDFDKAVVITARSSTGNFLMDQIKTDDIRAYVTRDGKLPEVGKIVIGQITKPLPSGFTFNSSTYILSIAVNTPPGT
jgi:hypothetical protein